MSTSKKLLQIKVTKKLVDAIKPTEGIQNLVYDWLQRIDYEEKIPDDVWKLFDASKCDGLIGDVFYIKVGEENEKIPVFIQSFPELSIVDRPAGWREHIKKASEHKNQDA